MCLQHSTGNLSALVEKLSLNSSTVNPVLPSSTTAMCTTADAAHIAATIKTTAPLTQPLPLPPPVDLPQVGREGIILCSVFWLGQTACYL